jgi:soluble lytic murein transglycosylase
MAKCSYLGLGLGLAAAALYASGPVVHGKRITSVVRADPHSGRLVRSVSVVPRVVAPAVVAPAVVAPAEPAKKPDAPAPAPPANLDEAVEQVASQHALPAKLIHSVIKVESNYNPNAVSSKGAMGLMQLIPSTARRFGVSDVFDPIENLKGGARYLRYLYDLYDGDYHLALAAYNAGEGAVARYGGVPPYAETRNYLVLVKRALEKGGAGAPVAKAQPPEPAHQTVEVKPTEVHNRIEEIVGPDGRVRYVSR